MTGQRVIVTGASGGIGAATARRFVAAGDAVTALGRDPDALEALARELGGQLRALVCDLTDEYAVQGTFAEAGDVDVLINSAGAATSAPLERTTLTDWRRMVEANATCAFLCTRSVLGGMRERGRGRIVTVASTAGLAGARYTAAYAASKHAAIGLMRAVACELAGTLITANAVCPAFVDTEMTRRSVERIVANTGSSLADAEAALANASPLGRLLDPAEVADAVVWLASRQAAAVNGQTIILDGGGIQS